MTKRLNYREPGYVTRAQSIVSDPHTPAFVLAETLEEILKRHNDLLRQLHITVENYNLLLDTYGPHHEVELGEPLARFSKVVRKGVSEND